MIVIVIGFVSLKVLEGGLSIRTSWCMEVPSAQLSWATSWCPLMVQSVPVEAEDA